MIDYEKLKRVKKIGKSFSLDIDVWLAFEKFCNEKEICYSNLINKILGEFVKEQQGEESG